MKEIIEKKYQCEVCGGTYYAKEEAIECEGRPVTQDKGVKIDDIVFVMQNLKREKAKVTRISVEKYSHKLILDVELLESGFFRSLKSNEYELEKDIDIERLIEKIKELYCPRHGFDNCNC